MGKGEAVTLGGWCLGMLVGCRNEIVYSISCQPLPLNHSHEKKNVTMRYTHTAIMYIIYMLNLVAGDDDVISSKRYSYHHRYHHHHHTPTIHNPEISSEIKCGKFHTTSVNYSNDEAAKGILGREHGWMDGSRGPQAVFVVVYVCLW